MRRLLAAPLLALAAAVLPATAASAHSLDSSTVSVHVDADSTVDATVSIALETLEEAVGSTDADAVNGYLAEHLGLTDGSGAELAETFSEGTVETVDGLASYVVDVDFGTADTSSLTLTYDAVIEALPDHEAVVVLTDAAGDVSTAGVVTAASDTVSVIGSTGLVDMVGHGLHHVLAGADHLLFLVTLLLTAPLVALGGRWVRRDRPAATARAVLGVVTSFTLGHSLTLVAASLGWVTAPTRLVELLVAVSVGVAAAHAWRPLVRRGENLIAAGFGLVHGLAFAGILADLGLAGTASVPALLAFNVGVELAQLCVVLLLFPSIYLVSRTRWYPLARRCVAALALLVAAGWVVERLGLAPSPFAGLEAAAMGHPWYVVFLVALVGVLATAPEAAARLAAPGSSRASAGRAR